MEHGSRKRLVRALACTTMIALALSRVCRASRLTPTSAKATRA